MKEYKIVQEYEDVLLAVFELAVGCSLKLFKSDVLSFPLRARFEGTDINYLMNSMLEILKGMDIECHIENRDTYKCNIPTIVLDSSNYFFRLTNNAHKVGIYAVGRPRSKYVEV